MFIESQVEYLPLPPNSSIDSIIRHIELCGRVAYKSEDKITNDSAYKFVGMLKDKGHYSPLEHGTIIFRIDDGNSNFGELMQLGGSPYSRVFYSYVESEKSERRKRIGYVLLNMRTFMEDHGLGKWISEEGVVPDEDKDFDSFLLGEHPDLSLFPARYTFRIICDRGISHELVRHRVFSFTQESTRYCNYTLEKFGKDLTFIWPEWLDKRYMNMESMERMPLEVSSFVSSCDDAKRAYFALIGQGWKPEMARAVLPNCLKTEVVMTGWKEDWEDFIKKRNIPESHPSMRNIAQQIQDKLLTLNVKS